MLCWGTHHSHIKSAVLGTPAQHYVLGLVTQYFKDQQIVLCWLLQHSNFEVRVLGTQAQHYVLYFKVLDAQHQHKVLCVLAVLQHTSTPRTNYT